MAEATLPPLTPARQALAEQWFGLARKLARDYAQRHAVDGDECESLAMYILTRAAAKRDPSINCTFGRFAYKSISKALWQRHVAGAFSVLKRPRSSPVEVFPLDDRDLTSRAVAQPIDIIAQRESLEALRSATPATLTGKQHADMRRYFSGHRQTAIARSRRVRKQSVSTVIANGVTGLRAFAVPVELETAA